VAWEDGAQWEFVDHCNIPGFCFKFWNKKIVLFVLIEILQGFKFF
jgi:hypothetical protein